MYADVVGNEKGYLVAMSQDTKDEPLVLPPGTQVILESAYDVADHFGVMGLWFVDLVGFDTSCPGAAYGTGEFMYIAVMLACNAKAACMHACLSYT